MNRTVSFDAAARTVALIAATVAGANVALAGDPDPVPVQPSMGDPLPGLTPEQLDRWAIGRAAFEHTFTAEEGLGPVFNKESCGNCHTQGNVLGGPGTQTVTRAGSADKGGFDPLEEYGGSLFQQAAISKFCMEFVPPPEIANVNTTRVTNGVMGYGLVEAILDQDIYDVRDAQPGSVVGEPHEVPSFEDEIIRVGRFGWKAQVATVRSFTADASQQEIGITTELVPFDNDPNGIFPPTLEECDDVEDPEDHVGFGNGVDRNFLDVVTDFQRFLAFPPQTPKTGMAGEELFNSIGCADCHHPSFTTPDVPELEEALRGVTIKTYGDFMLHNMSVEGDGIVQGEGTETMIKTAPLAGLRLRGALWHDGDTLGVGDNEFEIFDTQVRAAIARHDNQFDLGQGVASAEAFEALGDDDKAAVISFLGSLGLAEFDSHVDFIRTLDDFAHPDDPNSFKDCFGNATNPDDACAIHDADANGVIDDVDRVTFKANLDEALHDCDNDGISDIDEILDGTQIDADDDGKPDTCEACPSDTDGSGEVEVDDLVTVVLNWGPCPSPPDVCVGDIDRDGEVDVDDLVAVILGWGACP